MSIRAYLEINSEIKSTDDELIITKTLKKTPSFNITRESEIFEVFQRYGEDNTNNDCIGEISISKSDWQKAPKSHLSDKSVKQINRDFRNNDSVIYHCF